MNHKSPKILTAKESEDFQVYSGDHHLMDDTITTMHRDEMRDILRLVRKNWPTSLAHSMAIGLPDAGCQFDTVETRLQERLSFSE